MADNQELTFAYSFADIVAHMSALFILIYTMLFFPEEVFLYLLVFVLLFSIFMEKGVQILMIINTFLYLLLFQIFIIQFTNLNLIEAVFLRPFTENEAILFLNFLFFMIVMGLSVLSCTLIVLNYKTERQYNVEYAAVLGNLFFLIFAFLLAIMLAQDVNYMPIDLEETREILHWDDEADPADIRRLGQNLSYYLAVYQFFTFFVVIYYIMFTFIFFSAFSIRLGKNKISSLEIRGKIKIKHTFPQPNKEGKARKLKKRTKKGRY